MKFSFLLIERNDILKEIQNLKQITRIPTKFVTNNSDLFADFIFTNSNYSIMQSPFLSLLKLTNIYPVHKKRLENIKR